MIQNEYLARVLADVQKNHPGEPEFLQIPASLSSCRRLRKCSSLCSSSSTSTPSGRLPA